jgi:hypothetical protein
MAVAFSRDAGGWAYVCRREVGAFPYRHARGCPPRLGGVRWFGHTKESRTLAFGEQTRASLEIAMHELRMPTPRAEGIELRAECVDGRLHGVLTVGRLWAGNIR